MAQSNLLQLLLNATAPRNLRMLIARGSVPVPTKDILQLLVLLLKDSEPDIASRAEQTLASLDKKELAGYLAAPDCVHSVLEYFASLHSAEPDFHEAIIANPETPGDVIEDLALTVPVHLLEKILDNRVRILKFPAILENVKSNPQATAEVRRLAQEIEAEFFGGKKREYAIEETPEAPDSAAVPEIPLALEPEFPLEDLSLEGLPLDPEARQAEILRRLSSMSVREKIQHALFGTREIRSVLVRDTNKEVARSVLKSPKLTENEVEGIAAMRGVSDDILREIGNSQEWTRGYPVVQNLVRNPKTPPVISQRLLFRLRTKDLMMLTKDRSIPDAVRHNATRALNQRTRVSK